MFGNNMNQQQPQGGLFGSSGGGLFGGNQPAQQQGQQSQQGQALWGGSSMGSQVGQMSMGQQSGGLFGQQAQPQQTQGLSTGGGLFNQAKPTGQGLFGNSTSSSGLFQQNLPQQQQQGVFGGGGGLFGQTPPQGQTGQQGFGIGQQGQSGSNIFGQPQQNQTGWNQPQTAQTGIGIGGQMSTGQMGQSSFSFGQGQQPQQGQGIFGMQSGQMGGQAGGLGQTNQLGGGMGGLGMGQMNNQIKPQGLFSGTSTSGMFSNQPQSLFGGNQQMGQTGMGMGNTSNTFPGQQQTTMQSGLQSGVGGLGSSIFGGTSTTQQKPSGLISTFGGTTQVTPGGVQQGQQQQLQQQSNVMTGTYPYAYQITKISETSTVGNQQKVENVNMLSITMMQFYSNRSIEELRYEDYKNKKQGLPPPKLNSGTQPMSGMMGGTTPFGGQGTMGQSGQIGGTSLFQQQPQQQQPQTGGLFGNKPQGLFGTQQPTTTTTGFGISSGQPQQGGLFGTTPPFGGQQSQQMGQLGQTSQLGGQLNMGGGQVNQTGQIGGQMGQLGQMGQQSTTMPQGTLFGQQLPQTSSMTTTTTQPQLGGGLLGQQQQQTGLFGGGMAKPQSSLFGGTTTTTQPTGGLFASSKPEGSLFAGQTTTPQPTGGSLFSTGQQQTSLFGQPSTTQTGTSLLGAKPATTTTGGLFGSGPTGGLFSGATTTAPVKQDQPQQLFGQTAQPMLSTGGAQPQTSQVPMFPMLNLDYKSFLINSLEKQKSITDILNDLQKEYIVQDYFMNTYKKTEKPQEICISDSKYTYVPVSDQNNYEQDRGRYRDKEKDNQFENFLKSKRPHEPKKEAFPIIGKKEDNLSKSRNIDDKSLLVKSHSADSVKNVEKRVVKGLEKDFNLLEIGKESSKSDRNIDELTFCLFEPVEYQFKLSQIDRHAKLSQLKSDIAEKLRKNEKYDFTKRIKTGDFVLMRHYSVLKDNLTVVENNIKNKDTIVILLKENFTQDKCESETQSRKISNVSEKKPTGSNKKEINVESTTKNERIEKVEKQASKRKVNRLAPYEILPILNNPEYQTIPPIKEIFRMTVEELQNIENFTIYNKYGRIEFKGKTDLSKLNLDQIVNIQPKLISVYQNGDVDFKPEKGQGLNKTAVLHMYNIFPAKKEGSLEEEEKEKELFLMSLQKLCKNKKAEFKSYDFNTGEWVFEVDHFV